MTKHVHIHIHSGKAQHDEEPEAPRKLDRGEAAYKRKLQKREENARAAISNKNDRKRFANPPAKDSDKPHRAVEGRLGRTINKPSLTPGKVKAAYTEKLGGTGIKTRVLKKI